MYCCLLSTLTWARLCYSLSSKSDQISLNLVVLDCTNALSSSHSRQSPWTMFYLFFSIYLIRFESFWSVLEGKLIFLFSSHLITFLGEVLTSIAKAHVFFGGMMKCNKLLFVIFFSFPFFFFFLNKKLQKAKQFLNVMSGCKVWSSAKCPLSVSGEDYTLKIPSGQRVKHLERFICSNSILVIF